MTADTILVHRDKHLLTVTLNRPEKANALSLQMLRALTEVFEDAAEDEAVHVVLLTAAGNRVFSAGADLSELSTDPNDHSVDIWERLSTALDRLPVLYIALLNGPCIGGGMTLASGADIRIGVPETRFEYPVLKNGVLPGRHDVGKLERLTGAGRVSSILLAGQSVDAETALSWGLLDQLVGRSDLQTAALAMIETARAAPRDHVVAVKRRCREG